ncbi:MAG: hypothetical protein K2M91_04020 [Lachnospiraceae bacterium]|nr:hypothetical protein [Lachnospiraceae bacterium]
MTKYFALQDTPELKYAPRLKNVFGKFDIRDIQLETYPKLPERQVFFVEPSEKNIFTDIILSPFLLITPTVLDVIKMYKELCFYREVFLIDQLQRKSQLYFLPVFNETKKLQVVGKEYDNGTCISKPAERQGEKVFVDKNIFWVSDSLKRHTIISMDFAESLIRREVFGLGLKEVELYRKIEERSNLR